MCVRVWVKENFQPSSKYMLSHTKNCGRSKTMISTEFLKEIPHFHCLLKVVVLKQAHRNKSIRKSEEVRQPTKSSYQNDEYHRRRFLLKIKLQTMGTSIKFIEVAH